MTFLVAVKDWAQRIKRDVVVVYFAARNPATPWPVRALAWVVAAYALSPIDLIPDFIPILGYLDDLLLVPLALHIIVRLLPTEVLRQSRTQAEAVLSRPRSNAAAIVFVLIWVACTAAFAYWLYRLYQH